MTTAILRALAATFLPAALLAAQDLTDQEKESFLMRAEVVSARRLGVGVTAAQRVTLSSGERTHDAQFQDVDEFHAIRRGPRGAERDFRDCYRYNIAAYRLDRLLGLRMVPVSVQRDFGGKPGAMTWWVDDILMTELERYTKKLMPPDRGAWNDQMFQARLFNELVYNTDANLGNVIIDKDWKIWLIDFTRAFRLNKKLEKPRNLGRVDRRIWERLQKLDEQALEDALGDILLPNELETIFARRDDILARLQERILREGEAAVLTER